MRSSLYKHNNRNFVLLLEQYPAQYLYYNKTSKFQRAIDLFYLIISMIPQGLFFSNSRMNKGNPPPYSMPQPHHNVYPNLPQDPSYPPPPQHTVHVTQVPALGPQPTAMICPSCHAEIRTTVEAQATTKTHLIALLCCLFGCWPCCCIPYCMDSCQSQNHYCPNCRTYLGKYEN